ncbi:NAD-dependent epimerase/dehydratase family protein [Ornithinimicrobium faecis]|uniref:NAD-dependent epimerase/dehydratase family protein n=1 Tax=Ornithinimicrobium faecis TaxID=2934158 RepID=UPI002118912D|nr:NAD(P)-dependent oxidoreductase [Ornithinimicrobium sp. HY1745]
MKVLLAGATGAIGGPLLAAMAARGHEVLAIIRNPADRERITDAGAVPIVADVMDREGLLRAVDGIGADAVMHQATALRNAGRLLRPDDPTLALRRAGTAHLLAAARVVGARRFVTQSLITGYGYRDHGARVLTEDDAFGEPVGNVGDLVATASAATEHQVFDAEGIDGIALRYGMFYGPRAFSDTFADLLRKHAPIRPWRRSGTACFVHVDDAAEAAVDALERGRDGQAYNVVDDAPVTWQTFLDTVAEAHHTPRPISVPGRVIRLLVPYLGCLMLDTSMCVSHARATAELGWVPAMPDIRTGLGLSVAGTAPDHDR